MQHADFVSRISARFWLFQREEGESNEINFHHFVFLLTIFLTVFVISSLSENISGNSGSIQAYPPGNRSVKSASTPNPYPSPTEEPAQEQSCPPILMSAIRLGLRYWQLKNNSRLTNWFNQVNGTSEFNASLSEFYGIDAQEYLDALKQYTGSNRSSIRHCFFLDNEVFLPILSGIPVSDKKGFGWSSGFGGGPFEPGAPADVDPRFLEDGNVFNASWYFNWGIDPAPRANPWLEFIPMIWCECDADSNCPAGVIPNDDSGIEYSGVHAAVERLGSNYDGYLMFLNEPDYIGKQCGLHLMENGVYDQTLVIEKSINIYEIIRLGLPNAKLIGPHLSSEFDEFGWLEQWITRVKERNLPLPEGYGYHFYVSTVQLDSDNEEPMLFHLNLINALIQEHDPTPGKEIWFTEFGFDRLPISNESDNKIKDDFTSLINALESDEYDFVTRYSPYITRHRYEGFPDSQRDWPLDTDLWNRNEFTLSPIGETFQQLGILSDN